VTRRAWIGAPLAVMALAQNEPGSPLKDPRVRAIGNKLTCLCGCGHTVTACDMLRCSFSDPARVRIQKAVLAGESEAQILNSFVQDYGLKVLQQPPTEGFHLLGWAMPFAGLAAFTAICVAVIQQMRKPKSVPAAAKLTDAEARQKERAVLQYEQIIERELDKL
jgi:cytochrome c-type biogenesis protein CcmH